MLLRLNLIWILQVYVGNEVDSFFAVRIKHKTSKNLQNKL